MAKRILNVVTNVGQYESSNHPTGLWLSELTQTAKKVTELLS